LTPTCRAAYRLCSPITKLGSPAKWAGDKLANGELLAAAEGAGFDAMITADRDIRYQQSLAGRKIALTAIHWETIRDNFPEVRAAIKDAKVGNYAMVRVAQAAWVRRTYPPQIDC
jgi:hypothetical protein